MKILLTGGSGDLGKVLAYRIEKRGDIALRFDIREPSDDYGKFLNGSILDRKILLEALAGVNCIVHIAAWHGYHEFTKKKNVYDFWDVNVTGTFNIFQAATEANISKIIFISSEAVSDKNGSYGWTKVLGEKIAQRYAENHHLNVLTLRPRAFIPFWNKEVYSSFVEWCMWYWGGAVHINDVAQAVMQGIDLLSTKTLPNHIVLPVDGAYEYTQNDLENWDKYGSGTTFKKYYEKYYDLAIKYGLDPAIKPTIQDISSTNQWLGYEPHYSLMNLLEDLSKYGESGPSTIELDT
jgi:nucleoside-diphosphate-sugar epimerase